MYTIDLKEIAPFFIKNAHLLDDKRYNGDYFCNVVAKSAFYDGPEWLYDTFSNSIVSKDNVKKMYTDNKSMFPNYKTFKSWFKHVLDYGYYKEIKTFDDDFQFCVEYTVRSFLIENDLYIE